MPTCQICARQIKSRPGYGIAHHGFHRPRDWHGTQTESCPGTGRPPFEESRDALGQYLSELASLIQVRKETLEKFKSDPIAEVPFVMGSRLVTINRSDPLYDLHRRGFILSREYEIKQMVAESVVQQARYDDWKFM